MRRKVIYIIIGEGGTGKSSIIRALTGTYQGGITPILMRNGIVRDFFVWTQSSQEAGNTPQRDLDVINGVDQDFILMALRRNPVEINGTTLPSAQEYIDLIAQQHDIRFVTFIGNLDPLALPDFTTVGPPIPQFNFTINDMANRIRRAWDWI